MGGVSRSSSWAALPVTEEASDRQLKEDHARTRGLFVEVCRAVAGAGDRRRVSVKRTIFDCELRNQIGFEAFIGWLDERCLRRYDEDVFLRALIFMHRWTVATGHSVTVSNLHRLALIALRIADKQVNDDLRMGVYQSNFAWIWKGRAIQNHAQVCSLQAFNAMESQFLNAIKWEIGVSVKQKSACKELLLNRVMVLLKWHQRRQTAVRISLVMPLVLLTGLWAAKIRPRQELGRIGWVTGMVTAVLAAKLVYQLWKAWKPPEANLFLQLG